MHPTENEKQCPKQFLEAEDNSHDQISKSAMLSNTSISMAKSIDSRKNSKTSIKSGLQKGEIGTFFTNLLKKRLYAQVQKKILKTNVKIKRHDKEKRMRDRKASIKLKRLTIKINKEYQKNKDLTDKYEKMNQELKHFMKIVPTQENPGFKNSREMKDHLTKIEEEFKNFNLHRAEFKSLLLSKPIKYVDTMKEQLSIRIDDVQTKIKEDITSKFKRILKCEITTDTLKRELDQISTHKPAIKSISKIFSLHDKKIEILMGQMVDNQSELDIFKKSNVAGTLLGNQK